MSSGLVSFGCAGIGVVGEVELDAEPLPDIPVPAAPLEGEVTSDFGDSAIGAGAGEVVVGAGGGTVFSSFLQALRPTATRATKRSERFMGFPFRRTSRFESIRTANNTLSCCAIRT
jgi:hypothetical protein